MDPATASWEAIATKHREAAASKIPHEWKLPSQITDTISQTSDQNVLDIPRTCGLLTTEEIDITENYTAVMLLEQLASGKFTSVAVTTAFCKRAAIAQQLVSCLTEVFFEEALARAKYCDEFLAKQGKTLGPFHGLPISLKDSFNIKGIPSTIGYTSFIAKGPDRTDSPLVSILLSTGAVLYVKTNIPQTMMTADSHNNIFGRTLNPARLSLSAGGSSGGEGALSALRGSILGVGTDIAGSIRIPAFCNGVIGFKPSTRRIPYGGQTSPARAGGVGIAPCAGPICRNVDDAEYFMRHVLEYDCWTLDESVVPLPWILNSTGSMSRKLRLGYIFEDKNFPLHPAMQRIMKTVISILEAAGHTLIVLDPLLPEDILAQTINTAMKFFTMDPKATPFTYIARSGEPIIPSIPTTMSADIATFKPTLDDVFDLNVQMQDIKKIVRQVWVKEQLDAFIMPVFQGSAPTHDTFGGPPYTVLANLLDAPACAIPFGKANKEADKPFVRDVAYMPPYNADLVEGGPGGIQVVGRNLKDEDVIEVAKIVSEILKTSERK
ncbi:amidase [Cadophora sp. DSE1049]|nr:amidase [Cadophora sp. DSE1049]